MLDKKQEEWVARVAKTLAAVEKDETDETKPQPVVQKENKAEVEAKTRYDQMMKALKGQLERALPMDKEGKLRKSLQTASTFYSKGSFSDAEVALQNAGQLATVIVSQVQTAQRTTSGVSGDTAPLKGKELGGKYKNEQYQLDEHGNVMHGGEFRGDSDVRTRYYDDAQKDASAVRKDDAGRLVDADGKVIEGHFGVAVSQEQGTMHTFNPDAKVRETRGNYKLADHHSSPVSGKAVGGAGEMKIEKGVVREVTDRSGHYRPDGELTHQMVDRLEQQGVQRREQKLTDAAGKEVNDAAIQALFQEVEKYERDRDKAKDPSPYDPAMQKKKQQLQDLGIGMSNRDATVDVFDPKAFINAEEWETVKGDVKAIYLLVARKIGRKPSFEVGAPDFKNMNDVNDWVARLIRVAAFGADTVDEKKIRVKKKAEQFLQTGGNVEQMRSKEKLGEEIKAKRKDASSIAEFAKVKRMVDKLGGDKKLRELGVHNPDSLTTEQKFVILAKGHIPSDIPNEAPDGDSSAEEQSETSTAPQTTASTPRGKNSYTQVVPDRPRGTSDSLEDRSEEEVDSREEDSEELSQDNSQTGQVRRKGYGNVHNVRPRSDDSEGSFSGEAISEVSSDEEPPAPETTLRSKTGYDRVSDQDEDDSLASREEESEEFSSEEPIPQPSTQSPPRGRSGYETAEEFARELELRRQKEREEQEESDSREEDSEELSAEEPPPQQPPPRGRPGYRTAEDVERERALGRRQEQEEDDSDSREDDSDEEDSDELSAEESPPQPPPRGRPGYRTAEDVDAELARRREQEEEESDEFSESDEAPLSPPTPQKRSAMDLRKVKASKEAKHARQVEYDNLGGDQALLDKLLAGWKTRNQATLKQLSQLNTRRKTATGDEKAQIEKAVATLSKQLDQKDRMPSLKGLEKMSVDDKIAEMKKN